MDEDEKNAWMRMEKDTRDKYEEMRKVEGKS
jgi:hypothetical protein